MRRVAVTGLGAICSLGNNVSEVWEAAILGRCAIAPFHDIDAPGLRFSNAAQVRGYDPFQHFGGSKVDLLDRFAQFAVIAAREAVQDSRLEFSPAMRERTAVVTGTGAGGLATADTTLAGLYRG